MTTTISWPSRLPLPTFEGMSVEPQDACLRTEMEAGPARTRRRFTQVPTRIPVRWRFGPVDIILDSDPAALFGSIDAFHDLINSSLPLSW